MNPTNDTKPAPVAATPAKQAGAATPREPWWWVERSVWTERRLTRLTAREPANQVWFSLLDKTYAPANLHSAYEKVWRNGGSAGADEQTVAHFGRHAEAELQRLHEQLRDGTYRPQPVRRAWILDASNPSVTLTTLGKAARALGRKVKIELVPA